MGEAQMRGLALEVLNGAAPERIKVNLRALLQRLDLRGQTVTIRLTTLNGMQVDTAKMLGNALLVLFWKDNVPVLDDCQAAYKKFNAQGLQVVAISLAEKSEVKKLASSVKSRKISIPVYFVGTNALSDLSRQFGINRTPQCFLLDKQGKLRESGYRDLPTLDMKIASLLAEP